MQVDKGRKNRNFLRKLRIIKSLFYPLVIILDKAGIAEKLESPADRLLRRIGIGKSIREFSKYRNYGRMFSNDFPGLRGGQDILLFPGFFGVNSNFTLISLMLAKHFAGRQCEPLFLVCRSSVPVCQKENVFKTRKHNPWMCHECCNGYKHLSEKTGIKVLWHDDLIDRKMKEELRKEYGKINALKTLDQCSEYSYNGIEAGKLAMKNVLRYFLRGSFNGNNDEVKIYRKYLKSVLILELTAVKLFERYPAIKYSVIQNGTLAFESVYRIHCERLKIPYMTYENYMGKNTLIYKKNGEIMNFRWDEEYNEFRVPQSLKPEIEEKVSRLFSELQVGKHAFGVLNTESEMPSFLKQGDYVCLFTNVNFDTAVIGKHTIFDNMPDWLGSVVRFWEKNVTGLKLVIRVHPAEVVLRSATREFMGDFVNSIKQSENIIVIGPDEKVNSYDLISGMKYGLVYSSTIGMEIAYRGKICVVAGKPYYYGKPFVVNPSSVENYFEVLEKLNMGGFRFEINRDELNRFIYFIFYKRLKYLNGVTVYTPDSEVNTIYKTSEGLLSGNHIFLKEFAEELCINNDL